MIKPCIICGEDAHVEAYFNTTRGVYMTKVICKNPKCESNLHNDVKRYIKYV